MRSSRHVSSKTERTPVHRHANRGAHWQTSVGVASSWQPRTKESKVNRGKPFKKFNCNNMFQVCTYNVRTANDEHLDNLSEELEGGFKWDIIGISETKLKGKFTEDLKYGHFLYNSGVGDDCKRSAGVGFIIHKKHKEKVLELKGISPRIAYLKIKGSKNNHVFIQCYAPTTKAKPTDEDVIDFYNNLQDLIDSVASRDDLFVLGDFNSKVGGLKSTFPEVIGSFSNVKRGNNDRGLQLAEFCQKNQLYISNTHFKHRRMYTWTSPDGKTRNTIDYILVRSKFLPNVKNAHTVSCVDVSDHQLVRCTVRLGFCKVSRSKVKINFDIQKLDNKDTRNRFQEKINNELDNLERNELDNPQLMHTAITKSVVKASKEVLGQKKTAKKGWITSGTLKAIDLKNEIRAKLGDHSIQYKIHKSNVKKLCRIDKENDIDAIHKRLNELNPQQRYFETMKKLKEKRKTTTWGIKDKKGATIIDKIEIIKRWEEFYENLYKGNQRHSNYPTHEEIPEILIEELRKALKYAKNKKATGPDGINAELLKFGGFYLERILLKLLNNIISTGVFPEELKNSEIVTLYKKGDPLECGNYRPINLLNQIYKVFMRIIYNRISTSLSEVLPSTQAAYQPSRGTIEQIQSVQQIIEKCKEYNINGYICFVDYTKAFDSLYQPNLWQALKRHTNLPICYINFLIKAYERSKATIRTVHGNTRLIDILRGVKQGDILSALLFCVALSIIFMKAFEEEDYGISIGGIKWSDLGYADDLAVFAKSCSEMQEMIRKLQEESSRFGLNINFGKTKIMPIGPHAKNHPEQPIMVDNQKIKVVDHFEYLGRILSSVEDDYIEVKQRICKGWQAFQKHKSILTHSHISMMRKK